jgi:hypothetical protein
MEELKTLEGILIILRKLSFVLNEPEPEWKVVAHKRKKDRRSKEKEGNAADICGSAVASSAHKK